MDEKFQVSSTKCTKSQKTASQNDVSDRRAQPCRSKHRMRVGDASKDRASILRTVALLRFFVLLELLAVPDADPLDHVERLEVIDDLESVHHLAEHRVLGVEVRLRAVRDEALAGAGVAPLERHPDRAAQVRTIVELVADGVAGRAAAVA